MEMRMLRWTLGFTRLDRIRNTSIRQQLGITAITEKMLEHRLHWYRHVRYWVRTEPIYSCQLSLWHARGWTSTTSKIKTKAVGHSNSRQLTDANNRQLWRSYNTPTERAPHQRNKHQDEEESSLNILAFAMFK